MTNNYDDWVQFKIDLIHLKDKIFNTPIASVLIGIKRQKMTLLLKPWLELTRSRLSVILNKDLTWAEYDTVYPVIVGSCMSCLSSDDKKAKIGETSYDTAYRIIKLQILLLCSVLKIDTQRYNDLIDSSAKIQAKLDLITNKPNFRFIGED
jgi:hypothetical protein